MLRERNTSSRSPLLDTAGRKVEEDGSSGAEHQAPSAGAANTPGDEGSQFECHICLETAAGV